MTIHPKSQSLSHLSLQNKLLNGSKFLVTEALKAIGWLLVVIIGIGLGAFFLLSLGPQVTDLLAQTDKNAWYLSRASGFIAYTLFWFTMVFGLLLGTRLSSQLGRYFTASRLFELHQFTSLVAIGFAGFHALILLADGYLNLSIGQVLTPFGFETDTVGVGLGQLGFWLLFICAMSFYVKSYLGQSVWRLLHFLTFMAYMLISIHLFVVGSDNQALPLLVFYALSQSLVFVLIGYRLWLLNLRQSA
ncbi:ferric reductase-like protein [Psychrobacter phenylpyruvicus]|uniref:Ferric reductase like transmembrane component n=1 Tax=Psychrobacter phenylpyruvicus TaxID=29432 RepID=A0A379LJ39_9GAMM|nr:ferric reductase-like protein [Psychrobacter phenylpyruvicus]SUD90558.1 Uncharacterised protein [Psychrobacter phenylpyruvicus]